MENHYPVKFRVEDDRIVFCSKLPGIEGLGSTLMQVLQSPFIRRKQFPVDIRYDFEVTGEPVSAFFDPDDFSSSSIELKNISVSAIATVLERLRNSESFEEKA